MQISNIIGILRYFLIFVGHYNHFKTKTNKQNMGGWCLGSALCCAGSMCCNMLCMPCKKAGVHTKNYAKIGYTFFQVVWIGLALLFFFLSDKLVNVDFF